MNRGSLHTRSFKCMHFSVFRHRWSKNGFTDLKRFRGLPFRPAKPGLVNLYRITESCIRLNLLLWREPVSILRICGFPSCVKTFRDLHEKGPWPERTAETEAICNLAFDFYCSLSLYRFAIIFSLTIVIRILSSPCFIFPAIFDIIV